MSSAWFGWLYQLFKKENYLQLHCWLQDGFTDFIAGYKMVFKYLISIIAPINIFHVAQSRTGTHSFHSFLTKGCALFKVSLDEPASPTLQPRLL